MRTVSIVGGIASVLGGGLLVLLAVYTLYSPGEALSRPTRTDAAGGVMAARTYFKCLAWMGVSELLIGLAGAMGDPADFHASMPWMCPLQGIILHICAISAAYWNCFLVSKRCAYAATLAVSSPCTERGRGAHRTHRPTRADGRARAVSPRRRRRTSLRC